VFVDSDPDAGALQSKLMLQSVNAINHHFSVYKISLM